MKAERAIFRIREGGIRPWMVLLGLGIGCLAISIAFAQTRKAAPAQAEGAAGDRSRSQKSEDLGPQGLALFIRAPESTVSPRPAVAPVLDAPPPAALESPLPRGRRAPLLAGLAPDRSLRSAALARAPPAVPPRHGAL
jgi:hypothetical protein